MRHRTQFRYIALFLVIFWIGAGAIVCAEDDGDRRGDSSSMGGPDRVNLIVYLVWFWVVLGGLIYLLLLKIREADRIHRMRRRARLGSQ